MFMQFMLALFLITNVAQANVSNSPQAVLIAIPMDGERMEQIVTRLDAIVPLINGDLIVGINTPGGNLDYAYKLLKQFEAVRKRGYKVICYVSGLAASAGHLILTGCSERYARKGSGILWHEGSVQGCGRITMADALTLYQGMRKMNREVTEIIVRSMRPFGWSREELVKHMKSETMHIVEKTDWRGWLTVVTDIPEPHQTILRAQAEREGLLRE